MPAGEPSGRWDPWRAVEARTDVEVRLDGVAALLGGAMLVQLGDTAVIVIDPGLDARARRVALAHELVHLERGGGCDAVGAPPTWDAVIARDEATVDAIVAERLVPSGALASLADERAHCGAPLTPGEVAEAFGVTIALAERALVHLAHDGLA